TGGGAPSPPSTAPASPAPPSPASGEQNALSHVGGCAEMSKSGFHVAPRSSLTPRSKPSVIGVPQLYSFAPRAPRQPESGPGREVNAPPSGARVHNVGVESATHSRPSSARVKAVITAFSGN